MKNTLWKMYIMYISMYNVNKKQANIFIFCLYKGNQSTIKTGLHWV